MLSDNNKDFVEKISIKAGETIKQDFIDVNKQFFNAEVNEID